MSDPDRCVGCDDILFLRDGDSYCGPCREELGALRATMRGVSAGTSKHPLDLAFNKRYEPMEPKPMTQPEYLAHAKEVCDEIQRVIKAKSSDYANEQDALANFRGASDFGVSDLTGLLLRMNDKFQRAKAYSKRGDLKVADEGIEDVFMDLIGYSIAALALLKTEK